MVALPASAAAGVPVRFRRRLSASLFDTDHKNFCTITRIGPGTLLTEQLFDIKDGYEDVTTGAGRNLGAARHKILVPTHGRSWTRQAWGRTIGPPRPAAYHLNQLLKHY
jgi:hypothetical protein